MDGEVAEEVDEELIMVEGDVDLTKQEIPDDLKWLDDYLHEFDGPTSQVSLHHLTYAHLRSHILEIKAFLTIIGLRTFCRLFLNIFCSKLLSNFTCLCPHQIVPCKSRKKLNWQNVRLIRC